MKKPEVIFQEVGSLSHAQQRKLYKYARSLRDQDLKLAPFFLLAIALHLLVLFGISRPDTPSFATTTGRKYVEVTLTIEQPPELPPPQHLTERSSDAPNPVAGPADQPNSLAAPGPPVDDLPPPVDKVAPTVTPPPPSPTPPVPGAPPSSAPPAVTTPLLDAALALATGPQTPNSNPPAATGNGKAASSAPVSGTGHGGGGVQWSTGRGGNGHFYEAFYVAQGITWDNAQKYALAHGGYLATIHSSAENNFVFNLINDPKYWQIGSRGVSDGPWLGGCKVYLPRGEGIVWEWVNDEGSFKFTNWAPGEPDNLGGQQNRLHYYHANFPTRSATWDDLNGGEAVRGFVVECDHDPKTTNATPASTAPAAASGGK